ncbi:hypothetical protein BFR80_016515 [Acinetobacter pittii]|uniref:hypothetical protein n=1 Tax=Acinetobacter pittii TaxID=48296 RepID=UPI00083814C2|nr:hypothetical protein [Acinetobacter pittii]MCK0925677.1 hypothetical protein [Acinetobacter pittii]
MSSDYIEKCKKSFEYFNLFYNFYKEDKINYPDNVSDKDKDDFKFNMEQCKVVFQDFVDFVESENIEADEILANYIVEKMDNLDIYHTRKLNYAGLPFTVYGDKWAPATIIGWLQEYKIFIKNYLDQKKSAKVLIDTEIQTLRGRIENYTAAQIFEGNLEAYNIYNDSAKENFRLATYYESLFIITLISAGALSLITFNSFNSFQILKDGPDIKTIVLFLISKIFIAGIVVAICTYLIKRSSQHRKMSQIEKSTALELKAIGPYLKGISDQKIEEIKISLIPSYFGVNHIKEEDFHVNEALINNLKATSEILKTTTEAAKTVSDAFKK